MGWMLSLWKLRVGAEAYYLSQVASGLEDYYSGRGETGGRWLGRGSSVLGLEGEVSGEDLRAVLAGLNPGTGQCPNGGRLRVHRRRVPGFDLTFSAPKSVSVVYALGDPLVRAAVVDAHEAAVAAALGWLEREACWVRRGSNNREAYRGSSEGFGTRRLAGVGFVAAGFRHRVSRAGDPQVHTHVLVANMTRGADHRWSALDAQVLYKLRRSAGAVYDAAVRAEMTARLGVRWAPGANSTGGGDTEIAGVPARVVEVFSKRRVEIEAELAATGRDGAVAAADATLATRDRHGPVDTGGIDARWRTEAIEAGFGPEQLDDLLGTAYGRDGSTGVLVLVEDPDTGTVVEERVDLDVLPGLVAARLTGSDSSFTRSQVTAAIAQMSPAGCPLGTLDRLCDRVLADHGFVAIPPSPDASGWDSFEPRWTTRELLAMEADLIAAFTPRPHTAAEIPATIVDRILAGGFPDLGADQADAVRRITTHGLRVDVLVGRAGTGKTHTLRAVHAAFDTAGHRLVGVAPSAIAARGLTAGAGIEAHTLPRFHRHIAPTLTPDHIVVVDEAAMVGTRDLHRIITSAHTVGAKVILVGDHHQLPEITAGGGFAAAVTTLADHVSELVVNRRQIEPWEHTALDELRHGNPTAAYDAYVAHGRIDIAATTTDMLDRIITGWWNDHHSGRDTVMLAGTRAQTRLLNQLARRHHLHQHGHFTGPTITTANRTYQAGDLVVCTRNSHDQLDPHHHTPTRVDNGTRGRITHIHPDGHIDIVTTDGRHVRLTPSYLHDGHLDHGYAITIHKAQGITCDTAHIAGPDGLTRQSSYVALSRARHGAHLYTTERDHHATVDHHHSRHIPHPDDHPSADQQLLTALHNAPTKTFASHQHPDLADAHQLATTHTLGQLQDRLDHIHQITAQLRAHGLSDPTGDLARIEHAETTRRHLHIGGRVRAADRDNIGTVTHIADNIGAAHIRFTSATGHTSTRWIPWADLTPIDHPDPTDLTLIAQRHLDTLRAAARYDQHQWESRLAEHGIHPDEQRTITTAVHQRRELLAHRLAADPPLWLQHHLGPRPLDPTAHTVWNDELRHLAAWRDTYQLDRVTPGYGPAPTDPELRRPWQQHQQRTLRVRVLLTEQHLPLPAQHVIPLPETVIQERLTELDALIASAPADQRYIVGRLTTDPSTTPHDLLAALDQQQHRRDWILEHWPHIIERAELLRVAQSQPTPTPTALVDPATPEPTSPAPTGREILNRPAPVPAVEAEPSTRPTLSLT